MISIIVLVLIVLSLVTNDDNLLLIIFSIIRNDSEIPVLTTSGHLVMPFQGILGLLQTCYFRHFWKWRLSHKQGPREMVGVIRGLDRHNARLIALARHGAPGEVPVGPTSVQGIWWMGAGPSCFLEAWPPSPMFQLLVKTSRWQHLELQPQESEISLEKGGKKRDVEEQGKEEGGGMGKDNRGSGRRWAECRLRRTLGDKGWGRARALAAELPAS